MQSAVILVIYYPELKLLRVFRKKETKQQNEDA